MREGKRMHVVSSGRRFGLVVLLVSALLVLGYGGHGDFIVMRADNAT